MFNDPVLLMSLKQNKPKVVDMAITDAGAVWFLTETGELFGGGLSDRGQLGTGEASSSGVAKRASNVKQFSVSNGNTWYVTNSGDLYGTGDTSYGQMGNSPSENVLSFMKVAENVDYVACSYNATWYITTSGELYGCGANDYGQQGNGTTETVLTFTKRAENVAKVCCGHMNTFYITTSGDLYGCGSEGFLGLDNGQIYVPFTKLGENVAHVAYAVDSTWYITTTGDLYGCGSNHYGQQGDGTGALGVYRESFTKVAENVAKVVLGYNSTWYITTSGELYGCGHNYYGQQGSGQDGDVLTFTKRAENVADVTSTLYSPLASTLYVTTSGDVYGAGENTYGHLTCGDTVDKKLFTKGATNVARVLTECRTTLVITKAGTILGVGEGSYGSFGGSAYTELTPLL